MKENVERKPVRKITVLTSQSNNYHKFVFESYRFLALCLALLHIVKFLLNLAQALVKYLLWISSNSKGNDITWSSKRKKNTHEKIKWNKMNRWKSKRKCINSCGYFILIMTLNCLLTLWRFVSSITVWYFFFISPRKRSTFSSEKGPCSYPIKKIFPSLYWGILSYQYPLKFWTRLA